MGHNLLAAIWAVAVSAWTGEGIETLREAIAGLIDDDPETELTFTLRYRNQESASFVLGAMVHFDGQLIVRYEQDGSPSMFLDADVLRPQPGDPAQDEYGDHLPHGTNPHVTFVGHVTAIPLQSEDCRVFTISMHVYHRLPDAQPGQNFVDFNIHCCLPSNTRWINTPTPRLGRGILVSGRVVGLFQHNGRRSPIIAVSRLGFLNTTTPMPPAPIHANQATPS